MVKLIQHTGEVDSPDDATLPLKLEMHLRAPQFMSAAFAFLYGGSEIVIARADSVPEMEAWMKEHGLTDHPRLNRFRITEAEIVVKSHNWDPLGREILTRRQKP